MLRDGRVWLRGRYVEVRDKDGDHFDVVEKALVCANDCQAIFIRTDPPFDEDYLTCTWLLSFAERQGVRVVNSPAGIRSANEKLYALEFPELCPKTIVTNCRNEALNFIDSLGGRGHRETSGWTRWFWGRAGLNQRLKYPSDFRLADA